MSKSHKTRHGRSCKFSKDTFLASKNQKRAWTKRKRKRARSERARGKTQTRQEADVGVLS